MVEFMRAAVLLAIIVSAYMLGSARCAASKGKALFPPLNGPNAKMWYIVLAVALAFQYMQMNAY